MKLLFFSRVVLDFVLLVSIMRYDTLRNCSSLFMLIHPITNNSDSHRGFLNIKIHSHVEAGIF